MRQISGVGFAGRAGSAPARRGTGIYQQRQRQAQLAAMGQKANAGADCGQRQHHKALVQVELYKASCRCLQQAGIRINTFK